ncbi:MAG: DUF5776 domain-containing protein [Lentilactobacillus diolivorans]
MTAKASYVQTVYYQSLPKSRVITVIGKKGVNAYRTAKLTKQVKHYKNRTQLRVKKIVRHQSTTRYQLTNGDYVTGNKQLIIQGRY